MNEISKNDISITIDLIQNGIRIHKPVYRLLGSPKYLQLLIDPASKILALCPVSYYGDQCHKIRTNRMHSSNSYEIYSIALVKKLCSIEAKFSSGYSYSVKGFYLSDKNIVLFSLDKAVKIERES